MGLAMTFNSSSPLKADTPAELRDIERRLRAAITEHASAAGRSDPLQEDWRAAMLRVTSGKLKLDHKDFADLDSAMRFVAGSTGISNPQSLGAVLSIALVRAPVLMSFRKIGNSDYRGANGQGSHVVTIFGVQLPPATMADTAKPKLLLVNSAVKYQNNVKNVCNETDLSDHDRYSAITTLTDAYELKRFDGPKPYIVHFVTAVN